MFSNWSKNSVGWHISFRGLTGKFYWRGRVIFPDCFSRCEMHFFLVENFHFGSPKTNFSGYEKWIFSLPFSPCLFFPGRSATAEISQSEVLGDTLPCHPPPRYTTHFIQAFIGLSKEISWENTWKFSSPFYFLK